MVGSAVALDTEKIAAWALGIGDGEVDEEARYTHLRVNLMPPLLQRFRDLLLEHAVLVTTGLLGHREAACPGVVQEQLEREDALTLGPFKVDILVGDGSEHLAPAFRAAYQNIQ